MYWLKACPRCHGDLQRVRELGETYVSCLQCGRTLTAVQEQALLQTQRREPARGSSTKRVGKAVA